jgi:hypothetical protein
MMNTNEWSGFWFLNGGMLHPLWKRKKYTKIKEAAHALPKLAWDTQQKKIDELVETLTTVCNSMYPHPVEHPGMYAAKKLGSTVLQKYGVCVKGAD